MISVADWFSRLIPGATYAGPDQGLDFTGRAQVQALGPGIVTRVESSGSGWPGQGGMLVYLLTGGPSSGRYVYTAEDFSPDSGLSVGQKIRQGQVLGLATGSGQAPGIETGFAQDASGSAYGSPTEGKGTNPPDPQAVSFKQFVTTGRARKFTGSTGGNGTLANLWVQAGGSPGIANVMAAIAMAESGGSISATNQDSNGTTDYGIWQINSSHGLDPTQLTTDPLFNAKAAVSVYKSQGFGAWATYTNGSYKQFLGAASAATPLFTRPGGGTSGGGGSGGGGSSDDGSSMQAYLDSYDNSGDIPADTSVQTVSFLGFKSFGDYLDKGLNLATLGISGKLEGIAGGTADLFKAIIWVIQPIHLLQMVEFLIGTVLMGFGLQAAMQGRGETGEGFQTGESALSRSGLGRVSHELAAASPGGKVRKAAGKLKPAPAPHKTRRTALKVRYEREQNVANRNAAKRRGGDS